MSGEFINAAEKLVGKAEQAADREGVQRLKAENSVVGDACEAIAELSENGDISESETNALADQLSDLLARYNKTDLKDEFREYFTEERGDGIGFDVLLEERLESLQTIHSTDAKQGTVWRWHFSDGVQLETETSKDAGRKHYDWNGFKRDYFDSLVSLGEGEKISKPSQDRREPSDWQEFIDNLILEHSTPVEHVGPRTEATRMLRDYVSRNIGYTKMKHMRDRNGVWVDQTDDGEAAADGGVAELRVPVEEIKRICDQVGISTRGLQIELDARGVTHADTNGVSGAEYVDGVRVGYWSLSPTFADPEEIIEDPKTPAEQSQERREKQLKDNRTNVGATTDDQDEQPDPQPSPPSGRYTADDEDDDYQPGMTDSFGTDPDEVEDDE